MKQYIIEVIIDEQSDEFWEEATKDGKTGCDDLLEAIKDELQNWDATIRIIEFKDK